MRGLRLRGARVARGPNIADPMDLTVSGGRISFAQTSAPVDCLDLSGMLLLPGLINAHDRLDLSLPARIPQAVRLAWGGLRNLLSGVTTVAHHGPWERAVFENGFPVRVVRELGHAVPDADPADLASRFWKHPPRWPFIIPAAPGIAHLDKLGVLSSYTVLQNPPSLSAADLELLRRRQCSLILNGFTCACHSGVPASLATDSTPGTEGDLLDVIRAARLRPRLPLQQIFAMVTTEAAAILRLRSGQGSIAEGAAADLIAVPDTGQTPAEAIFHLQPELVMVAGRIKLASPRFAIDGCSAYTSSFEKIRVERRGEWLVDAPIAQLFRQAGAESNLHLGGRSVSYSI